MRRGILLSGALLAMPIAWLGWPPSAPERVIASPVAGYAEAVDQIAVLAARDTMALHDQCGTVALLHGAPAPRAVVLLHGFTNCPLQFLELGRMLHAAGDNVLIPRIPHHGLADRMTADLVNLDADELTALVAECIGIAHGLGDTVVVAGLSTSGVAAAWAAQECDGVDRIVTIAPAFRPPWGPGWIRLAMARVVQRMPNTFFWWNAKKKADLDGPTQCYPRFPTRALGESYRLGEEVMRAAHRSPPRTRDVGVVTTWGDDGVDNDCVATLGSLWRDAGARVRTHEFPDTLDVPHDMIDPLQVGARVSVVYPILIRFIQGERLGS